MDSDAAPNNLTAMVLGTLPPLVGETLSQWANLFQASGDVMYRWRVWPDRALEFISPGVERLTGYAPAAFYTQPDLFLAIVHPEDQPHIEPMLAARPVPTPCPRARWLHVNGGHYWLEHRWAPIFDEAARTVAVAGLARVLTGYRLGLKSKCRQRLKGDLVSVATRRSSLAAEQHRTADLQRANKLLTSLSTVAARVMASTDVEDVLAALGTEMAKLSVNCAVGLLEPDRQSLVLRFGAIGAADLQAVEQILGIPLKGMRLSRSQLGTFFSRVVDQQQPVYDPRPMAQALMALPELAPIVLQKTLSHLGFDESTRAISVPLSDQGRLLGALLAWGSALQPADVPAFSVFADQVAVAMARSRLLAAERRRRHEAEMLRTASIALSGSLDLGAVLNTLLEHLLKVVPCNAANVMLINDDNQLEIRAARGYEHWLDPTRVLSTRFERASLPAALVRLFTGGTPVLVADTRYEPGWNGEITGSWLGVPLHAGGRIIGLCSLDNAEPSSFTSEHVALAQALASQAAVAIQNSRLFNEVRQGRERLKSLSRQLVEVQEAERRSLARELHDEIGQVLTGLKFSLHLVTSLPPEAAHKALAEARAQLSELLGRVRELSLNLRPAMLDNLGLVPALRWHFDRYTSQTAITVDFHLNDGAEARYDSQVETTAYRVVQEALTNVARHAAVNRVDVRLLRNKGVLNLEIEDDGVGFEVARTVSAGCSGGLLGMHERVSLVRGSLIVESEPGAGTRINAKLPLDSPVERRSKKRIDANHHTVG